MAAHLFGYVGEVNDSQIGSGDNLKSGDIVGQSGLEKIYNALLMGEDGARRVVVNSVGREIRTLDEDTPIEGKRLQLTIDSDVQKAIEDGFESIDLNGAAVVLDPNSGEVLGFTSRPAYDPNAVRFRHRPCDLDDPQYRSGPARSTIARFRVATRPGPRSRWPSRWPPSRKAIITPDFQVYCPGHATFYGHDFKCWRFSRGGHGSIDLRHAIEQSCDVYFYTVANMLGVDKINKWATLLGLGVMSGIDLPNEVPGPRAVDRVEARAHEGEEVVRRRDDLGGHRPGRGSR